MLPYIAYIDPMGYIRSSLHYVTHPHTHTTKIFRGTTTPGVALPRVAEPPGNPNKCGRVAQYQTLLAEWDEFSTINIYIYNTIKYH
jgi:hypothetical protein